MGAWSTLSAGPREPWSPQRSSEERRLSRTPPGCPSLWNPEECFFLRTKTSRPPLRRQVLSALALPSGTGLLWAPQQPLSVVMLPGRRFRDSERAVCILRTQLLLEDGEGWPAIAHTEGVLIDTRKHKEGDPCRPGSRHHLSVAASRRHCRQRLGRGP